MDKCCIKCNIIKSIGDFRKDRQYVTNTCRACHLAFLKEYRAANSKKIANQKANWHQNNRDHVLGRRANSIQLKLANALRVRLNMAIRNNKGGSAVRDLGCSIEELKLHLESKFKPGMTWSNWGRGVGKWNIDHIKPISLFDLQNPNEVKDACNFNNLQPLWSNENLSKGAKC